MNKSAILLRIAIGITGIIFLAFIALMLEFGNRQFNPKITDTTASSQVLDQALVSEESEIPEETEDPVDDILETETESESEELPSETEIIELPSESEEPVIVVKPVTEQPQLQEPVSSETDQPEPEPEPEKKDPPRIDTGTITVCLDAGHGGSQPGAQANGLDEKNVNLAIALRVKNILQENGINVIMTRDDDTTMSKMQDRVDYAYKNGATYMVSLHNNSGSASDKGCMAIVTRSHYQAENAISSNVYQDSLDLGTSILAELTGLGIPYATTSNVASTNGLLRRDSANGSKYPDGTIRDYYGIIACSTEYGMPSTIIEHCFISNSDEAATWLATEDGINKLAEADAKGIMNFLASR